MKKLNMVSLMLSAEGFKWKEEEWSVEEETEKILQNIKRVSRNWCGC